MPLIVGRTEWLLAGLDRVGKLVEIGASFAPLAPCSGGWQTTVVDHASQDDLLEKYKDIPGAASKIETVHVVLKGRNSLDRLFPAEALGSFNGVINSHVIEHMPDPVGFFKACENYLK